jgi:hypothetical protein
MNSSSLSEGLLASLQPHTSEGVESPEESSNPFGSEDDRNPMNEMSAVIESIDYLKVCCVLLLGDSVAPSTSTGASKPVADRNGAAADRDYRRTGRANATVQKDIERLFSQRIVVFDPAAIGTGTADVLVSSLIKVTSLPSVLISALFHIYRGY